MAENATEFANDVLGLREPPRLPSMDEAQTGRRQFLEGELAASLDKQRSGVEAVRTTIGEQSKDRAKTAAAFTTERKAADPGTLKLDPAPSVEGRPLGASAPNASLLTQLQTVMMGAAGLGMQIRGLSGSAIGAVEALRGMSDGWFLGDEKRVKDEYKAWQAASDKLIAEHRGATDKYKRLVEDQKISWEQKHAQYAADLGAMEWAAGRQAIETGQIEAAIKAHEAAQLRLADMERKGEEFKEKMRVYTDKAEADRALKESIAEMQDATKRDVAAMQAEARAHALRITHGSKMLPGYAWFHTPSGERYSAISQEQYDASPKAWKRVDAQDIRSLEVLEAEAPTQLEILRDVTPRVLAKAKGQNLAKYVENQIERGLSDVDVRRFVEASHFLDITVARALSGTAAPRIAILKKIEGAGPSLSDRQATAEAIYADYERDIENRIGGIKGQPRKPAQNIGRTIRARNADGKEATIKLRSGEPLPAGWSEITKPNG